MDYSKQYLTFESLENNNVIYIIAQRYNNDINPKTISASTDNGDTWTEYTSTSGGTMLATLNTGDKLLLKGENASYAFGSRYNNFYVTKQYNVYGNIMSLVSGDTFDDADTLTENYTFDSMFNGSTTLVSAENLILPALNLANNCYAWMFNGCTNLIATPKLPATTLTKGCYAEMFQSCRSLTVAPELPATTLANGCYESMFGACTSLVSAPELPATTLANNCYGYMFRGCASFTTTPELPATTLVNYCYREMFRNCTNLGYIKCLATDISATGCLTNWVDGVAASGTFVKAASMSSWTTGTSGIPIGWVVKNHREDDTTQCGYTIADLERGEIYLFDSISGLSDNGVLTNDALVLSGLNIEFSEEETLNERYRFNKSVSFSIKGYANLNLLDGRRYIAVKNGDGRVVLVTTEFPAAVTYEYNLSSSDDTTRYTFAVQDNIPSTFVDYNGITTRIADDVCSYFSPDIELSYILTKFINVNELTDRAIIYDGEWDTIKAIRNSVEVSESLSNDRYTKTITFRILHSNDWQYLIGEFKNNLYTVKVNSHKTKNLYVGNEFGLQPLYSIDGNVVTITLTEIANIPLVRLTNEEKSQIVGHRYIKTDYDPCSGNERAQYVLREKVDGNGNGTGEYECYTGYENIFDDYNITGTFSDTYTYYNAACKSENCTIATEIPPRVVFFDCWGQNNNKKNQFAFRADCDWEVISGSSVTPTSGTANTDYTLSVPKHYYDAGGSNVEETNIIQAGDTQFKFDYVYYGDNEHNAPIYGLTNGIDYYIDCNGGNISLKANTEMIDWNNVNWTRFDLPLTYSDGFINIYIPPNTYTYDLEFDFEFESDDYTCVRNVIRIHQSRVWEFWAYNNDCEYICENGNKYHKEWRYTGTTSSNAVITDTFRKGDLMETNCRDCLTIYTKWEQTYNILCVDGVAFFVDLEYESTDQNTWALSGGVRLREQATNADIDACVNPEYQWRITENTVCDN